jgi:hypothetical protein
MEIEADVVGLHAAESMKPQRVVAARPPPVDHRARRPAADRLTEGKVAAGKVAAGKPEEARAVEGVAAQGGRAKVVAAADARDGATVAVAVHAIRNRIGSSLNRKRSRLPTK